MKNKKYELPRVAYDKKNGITKVNKEEKEGKTCIKRFQDGLGSKWKVWKRRRIVVAVLAFCGFMNVYFLRVNLSIAIVAMTEPRPVELENGTVIMKPEFDWDSKDQGLVLSSFFYGYIFTQILGGYLASRIGGARVFGLGIATTALLTLVTPVFTKMNFFALIAIRIIEGFFEGVTFPCITAVWSKWAPPLERSMLATIGFSGSFIGTVIAMPLSGIIAEHLGWEAVFYVFGVIGLIWWIFWAIFVKEAPKYDPYISKTELKYIEDSLGNVPDVRIKHPWSKFFSSPPVYAMTFAHFSENWGFYTMLTQLPTFMNDALNFKIEKAGFLSALPYLVMSIVLQASGHLADFLRSRKILSTTSVRKIFTCGAFLSQTVFMVLAAQLNSATGIIACITVAVGLGGFCWSGFGVNHLDLAPQHAGVLMGITNTLGTVPGMLSPVITGFVVQHKTKEEWKVVFYIAASIYLVGAVIYGIFASGEKQPWAFEPVNPKDAEENKKSEHSYDNKAMQLDKNGD